MHLWVLTVLCLILAPALRADSVAVTEGGSFQVNYNGFESIGGATVNGLTAQANYSGFDFTYISAKNITELKFSISILNNSSSPITASRVAILGFNTTPTLLASPPSPYENSVTGIFDEVKTSGNFPYGIGTVEFCLSGVNCAGSGSAGVTKGNTGTVDVTLYFAGNVSSLNFDNFYVKYQSVDCPTCSPSINGGSLGGSGTPAAPPVPEPATLTLLGSGILGARSWARRRRGQA